MDDTLKTTLNFKNTITIAKKPIDMNRPEHESYIKFVIEKLLSFTKKINIHKKERKSINIQFEEIPATLIIAFCILPYAMVKMEISIYRRCKDASFWDFLNNRAIYSNSNTYRIFIHDFIIDEITPFLFPNRNPIMLVIDTFFFKIARTFFKQKHYLHLATPRQFLSQ
jgi:hypothetical protein